MPIIPTTTGSTVKAQALNAPAQQIHAPAAAFGPPPEGLEQIGQFLHQQGVQQMDEAAQQAWQADQQHLAHQELKMVEHLQTLEQEALSPQGAADHDRNPPMADQVDRALSGYEVGFKLGATRAQFQDRKAALADVFKNRLSTQQQQRQQQVETHTFETGLQREVQTAVAAWQTPQERQHWSRQALKRVFDYAQRWALPPSWVAAQKQALSDGVYGGVVQHMLAQGALEGAQHFLTQHRGQMSQEQGQQLQDVVARTVQHQAVQTQVETLFMQHGGSEVAAQAAAKQLDQAISQPVAQGLAVRYARAARLQAQAEREHYTHAINVVRQGQHPDTLPPATFHALTPLQRQQLQRVYAHREAQGDITLPERYAAAFYALRDNPEQFEATHFADGLSDADLRFFEQKKQALILGEEGPGHLRFMQGVAHLSQAEGLSAQQIGLYLKKVAQEVTRQQRGGGGLSGEDHMRIAQDLYVDPMVQAELQRHQPEGETPTEPGRSAADHPTG
ncbi:hypothetical protein [Magnetococcus sp. PR-3]|uniref:hypothetical protein n=1 Tax=Magnetococcus sp. PR-3 TaxID=3120355 RepID=UPI002FCE54A4